MVIVNSGLGSVGPTLVSNPSSGTNSGLGSVDSNLI